MSLPYYYTENSPPQPSLDIFFSYAKQKLATVSASQQQQDPMNNPNSLLKVFEIPSAQTNNNYHSNNSKSRPPSKQSLENCLQFPSYREFKSNYIKTEQSPEQQGGAFAGEGVFRQGQVGYQCFEGLLRKDALIQKYNSDPKAEMMLNRMQLNEFLFKKTQEKEDSSIDYSNIKEYKFTQTVGSPVKSRDFQNIEEINTTRLEKTKKAQRNFLTPNRVRENPTNINEFHLNELSSTLRASSTKKKKKIFDLTEREDLKHSNLQPHYERIMEFQKNAISKGRKFFTPDLRCFFRKHRIIDKDGEDKSRIFLKQAFLENAGMVFENFEIKVAMKASLVDHSENNDRNGLLILLYYCNKNKGDLTSCSLRFEHSKTLRKVKIFPAIENFTIEGNATKRQDFLVSNYEESDELVNLTLEYKNEAYSSHQILQKIQFPLPMPITKFMEFKPIDTAIFRTKWRYFRSNSLISDPKPLDHHILMIPDDIFRYFPFLLEMSSIKFKSKDLQHKKGNQRSWGGYFTINGGQEFLIKIRIIEDFYISFEVRDREEKEGFARKILETLCFMFCQND